MKRARLGEVRDSTAEGAAQFVMSVYVRTCGDYHSLTEADRYLRVPFTMPSSTKFLLTHAFRTASGPDQAQHGLCCALEWNTAVEGLSFDSCHDAFLLRFSQDPMRCQAAFDREDIPRFIREKCLL